MNQIQIFFFYALAGWINREQQKIIDYLLVENKTWRELYGKKRPRWQGQVPEENGWHPEILLS